MSGWVFLPRKFVILGWLLRHFLSRVKLISSYPHGRLLSQPTFLPFQPAQLANVILELESLKFATFFAIFCIEFIAAVIHESARKREKKIFRQKTYLADLTGQSNFLKKNLSHRRQIDQNFIVFEHLFQLQLR